MACSDRSKNSSIILSSFIRSTSFHLYTTVLSPKATRKRKVFIIITYFLKKCVKGIEKATRSGAFHKAGFDLPKKQKEYEQFVRTPFYMPATQGIVCYTFQVNCRAVMSLPCVKGGGLRSKTEGL